jgi:hypothetical protein
MTPNQPDTVRDQAISAGSPPLLSLLWSLRLALGALVAKPRK